MTLRNAKDFWSGVLFAAVGLFFIVTVQELRLGTAARMGPAYFPTILGGLLTFLGLLLVLRGFLSRASLTAADVHRGTIPLAHSDAHLGQRSHLFLPSQRLRRPPCRRCHDFRLGLRRKESALEGNTRGGRRSGRHRLGDVRLRNRHADSRLAFVFLGDAHGLNE